jgi:tRNA modification GTPase|tara:strand:- start:11648 stop:12928 length:1281 start_codon:yes stop_codon:yes gene_type:complete
MSDGVFALATPVGRSAVAVVRVSGFVLPEKLVRALSIKKEDRGVYVRRVSLGSFSDSCLILNFPAPNSYTGEHLIEIHTHGSPAIVGELFSFLESVGLREADRGEFSKRAFLNEKMDLSSAESVMSGVFAESVEELKALEDFRSGSLGVKIKKLSKKIESLLVEVESQLDFSDEDGVSSVDIKDVSDNLFLLSEEAQSLIKNFSPLRKDSLKKRVVLTGEPNVGKSSLFNALLDEKVAIVSASPGTTRDIVRKSLFLSGVEVGFEDTAGVRDVKSSQIEAEGIEMAKEAAASADLCVEVFDDPLKISSSSNSSLVVLNKIDLLKGECDFDGFLGVSAKKSMGLNELRDEILKKVQSPIKENLVSERIYLKLESAAGLLKQKTAEADFFETTAQNLRDCLKELEGVYGVFDNEVVLDQIFNNFCIGK